MYEQCEIVIPPWPAKYGTLHAETIRLCIDLHVKMAVEEIMDRYAEDSPERFHDGGARVGGHFAGRKRLAQTDRSTRRAFYDWMEKEKVRELWVWAVNRERDESREAMAWLQQKVDAKFNEMFPCDEVFHYPLFVQFGEQIGQGLLRYALPGDVMALADVPLDLICARVILAALGGDHEELLQVAFMVNDGNRLWDRTVMGALELYRRFSNDYPEKYPVRCSPADDWLVVTVDYHR